jgi:hypothetical protein
MIDTQKLLHPKIVFVQNISEIQQLKLITKYTDAALVVFSFFFLFYFERIMHYPPLAAYPPPEYFHPSSHRHIKLEHVAEHDNNEASNKVFVGGRGNRGITPGIL